MQRFTAYRRNLAERGTHNELQRNADDEPQFEGVIWSDGTVTLRWLTACKSTSVWNNLEDMLNIHGHPEYGTEFVWHDGGVPEEWKSRVAKYIAENPYSSSFDYREEQVDIVVLGLGKKLCKKLEDAGITTIEKMQGLTRAWMETEAGLTEEDINVLQDCLDDYMMRIQHETLVGHRAK